MRKRARQSQCMGKRARQSQLKSAAKVNGLIPTHRIRIPRKRSMQLGDGGSVLSAGESVSFRFSLCVKVVSNASNRISRSACA